MEIIDTKGSFYAKDGTIKRQNGFFIKQKLLKKGNKPQNKYKKNLNDPDAAMV